MSYLSSPIKFKKRSIGFTYPFLFCLFKGACIWYIQNAVYSVTTISTDTPSESQGDCTRKTKERKKGAEQIFRELIPEIRNENIEEIPSWAVIYLFVKRRVYVILGTARFSHV